MVPVSPKVRCLERYGDDVTGPRGDVAIAARADVVLRRLVRLNATNLTLDGGGEIGARHPGRSAERGPEDHRSADDQGGRDEEIVPVGTLSGGVGVESHVVSIVVEVQLSQPQIRILGVLVEKERTTPDDYPLTANSIMRGANQTTSRDPIVSYDNSLIETELAELKDAGLVRFVHSPSNRATKYRQVLNEAWDLDERQLAVLGLLFLRGDQTVGELRTRGERLTAFASTDEVVAVLVSLTEQDVPFVVLRPRLAGQKDARWGHRWAEFDPDRVVVGQSGATSMSERVSMLEASVAVLRAELDELRDELGVTGLD